MKVEYANGGQQTDFATALEMLTDGEPQTVTLVFDGMDEAELDEFVTFAKGHAMILESGTDDLGRTHIRLNSYVPFTGRTTPTDLAFIRGMFNR